MLILSDNDVVGAVAALQRAILAGGWEEYIEFLDLRFVTLAALGLPRDAKDLEVWRAAQQAGAILITGNRSGGEDSLDHAIERYAGPDSLPVLTIADPQKVTIDPDYAIAAAIVHPLTRPPPCPPFDSASARPTTAGH